MEATQAKVEDIMSFISITAMPNGSGYTLFALKADGTVWAYNSQRRDWEEHSKLPEA